MYYWEIINLLFYKRMQTLYHPFHAESVLTVSKSHNHADCCDTLSFLRRRGQGGHKKQTNKLSYFEFYEVV